MEAAVLFWRMWHHQNCSGAVLILTAQDQPRTQNNISSTKSLRRLEAKARQNCNIATPECSATATGSWPVLKYYLLLIFPGAAKSTITVIIFFDIVQTYSCHYRMQPNRSDPHALRLLLRLDEHWDSRYGATQALDLGDAGELKLRTLLRKQGFVSFSSK